MSRTTPTLARLALWAMLLTALVGCSKDSPTQPVTTTATQTDADDASALVGLSQIGRAHV